MKKGYVKATDLVGEYYTTFDEDLLKLEARKSLSASLGRLAFYPLQPENRFTMKDEIKRLEKKASESEKKALRAYERGLASIK